MTIPPNVKYKDKFSKAYKDAKKRKVELWEVGYHTNKTKEDSR
jgi:hypothetical protein|tara:strand:+ start:2031 stop:2159 length:129 start_codon:yes stop_codon:yes gene_type:complete